MRLTKEKIYGFSGSTLFCLLLMLLLFFMALRTEIKQAEEGVLVNFGNVDLSSGTFEPMYRGENREAVAQEEVVPQEAVTPQAETTPAVQQPRQTTKNPPVITQNVEQTVAVAAAKKEAEKRQQEIRLAEAEQRRVADAQRKQAAEEQQRRNAINNQVSGAFGTGTSTQGNQGTGTSGTGNQGSTQGNSDRGAYTGVGGYGEFALSGRTLGSGGLPKPAYSVQEEGRIVISVTVDPKGNVIFAEIGKGTNIDNATMRNSALEAARKAKFNTITGNNNQSGTITYKYFLK